MSRQHVREGVIGILALVSIVLLAVESLATVSQGALIGIYASDLLICVVFAYDFIRRLRASESRARFMKANGYEILAMIPAVAIYALGSLPPIGVAFRSLRLVRVILLLTRMKRVASKSGGFVGRSNLLALFGITAGIIFVGAYSALVLDSGTENARITNFSDAIWWSISTVTTVGYGDIVPSSLAARIMGMGLMVVGIGVMAAFISQVSATLVESRLNRQAEKDDFEAALKNEIKGRIDNIEHLTENELVLLVETIHTLRRKDGVRTRA